MAYIPATHPLIHCKCKTSHMYSIILHPPPAFAYPLNVELKKVKRAAYRILKLPVQ